MQKLKTDFVFGSANSPMPYICSNLDTNFLIIECTINALIDTIQNLRFEIEYLKRKNAIDTTPPTKK
jgi:hypothetical protein